MKRFLAHRAVIDGTVYEGLTLVTVLDDGTINAEPYTHETHSTVFVNGTLTLDTKHNDFNKRPQR